MIFSSVLLADDAGPGSVQDRIKQLVSQIQAQPTNEVPLLQLAHLYAQIWLKNRQPEVLPRILGCLQKAIALETGQYAAQLRQILLAVGKQAAALNLQEPLSQLKTLQSQLDVKTTAPVPPAPASEPEPEPAPPQAGDMEPEIGIVEAEEPRQPPASEEEPQPSEGKPEPTAPLMDIEPEVETVDEPEKREAKTSQDRDTAIVGAQALASLQGMFDNGRVDLLLQTYATLPPMRVKQRIIEGLLERLDQWKIEPILAAAALENDEKMFRQILRLLLKADKAKICQQIQMQSYSPDLQKVAVTVLGELGLRSTLPKLKEAVEMRDPIVRCVALNGIARAGKAAEQYIPLLVETAKSDPNKGVRLAAVKAIQTMNLQEAYEALEKETSKANFDAKMFEVIEAMRQKYGAVVAKKSPTQIAKEKEAATKAAQARKKVVMLLFLLGGAAVAVWYFLKHLPK
jgi:hypothetical protein